MLLRILAVVVLLIPIGLVVIGAWLIACLCEPDDKR
jgi:phage shock protein PspC (stress-responsive transcriptional regulator)